MKKAGCTEGWFTTYFTTFAGHNMRISAGLYKENRNPEAAGKRWKTLGNTGKNQYIRRYASNDKNTIRLPRQE